MRSGGVKKCRCHFSGLDFDHGAVVYVMVLVVVVACAVVADVVDVVVPISVVVVSDVSQLTVLRNRLGLQGSSRQAGSSNVYRQCEALLLAVSVLSTCPAQTERWWRCQHRDMMVSGRGSH